MNETMAIATQLVDFCRQGKPMQAIEALYAPGIVSIEPFNPQGSPRTEGFDAVKAKSEWWAANHEVHKTELDGPWPHGDRFIVRFRYDVTGKSGPMAGRRMTLDETGLYTVKDGKIIQEEFFYHMG